MERTRGRAMPSPGLVWEPGRVPFATRFGDVYYSRENGLSETRHVFLRGCGLPEAWQGADVYVVGELGFGTGLNFLATWELWRRTRPPGARLHYIAAEGFPLTPRELGECLEAWPELHALAATLLEAYPEPQPGFHRVLLAGADDVLLTLLMGDAADMLSQAECEVDAWFLDGFSPEKNGAMWRSNVFAEMARLSHTRNGGSVLATYSVAGDVRRSLDTAGFDVMRAPGYGRKREMLCGRFRGTPAHTKPRLQPWFAKAPKSQKGHAAIIGGGLAGTNAAFALRRRGWQTTVIDRREALARETSGNPTAAIMPRLTAGAALDGRFYAAAWRFAGNVFEALRHAGASFHRDPSGLLQLATTPDEAARQDIIASHGPLSQPALMQVDWSEASDIAGVALAHGGLYFPRSGWLDPAALCAALAQASQTVFCADVRRIAHEQDRWRIYNRAGDAILEADVIVLANALGARTLAQTAWLPVAARRGQVTFAPLTPRSTTLRTVLSYGGAITPAFRGVHSIGATFEPIDPDVADKATDIRAEDHRHNLAALDAAVPGLMTSTSTDTLSGRAAVRCTSPDHLPMVGPLPQHDAYLATFADLRRGHPWTSYSNADYLPGLYALTGLGSHGVVSAPLAAELLACHITGEPWLLERDLVTALHPARFAVRDLKRRDV